MPGGHKGGAFKNNQRGKAFSNNSKPSGSGFKKSYPPRDGPHAANLVLPPPLPPPSAYSPAPQDTEQHFAFAAAIPLVAPEHTRDSGTKRPYKDIEEPQDLYDAYPPNKKRRINDKTEVDIEEPQDLYDVYPPNKQTRINDKTEADLKSPMDAIIIKDVTLYLSSCLSYCWLFVGF